MFQLVEAMFLQNAGFSAKSTFSKPLERQVTEGISITNSKADLIMNSKSEYHQPAVQRVQTTREVRHGS